MKEEVIIEGNKLIAEFMGYEYIGGDVMHYPYLRKGDEIIAVHNDVCYHSSWDWLMPVVEKITQVVRRADFDFQLWDEDYDANRLNHFTMYGWSQITPVWEAVIAFLKWYNSQKQEQESNR